MVLSWMCIVDELTLRLDNLLRPKRTYGVRKRQRSFEGEALSRPYFEHILFATLQRRAGIANRSQLQKAIEAAGIPVNREYIRRNIHDVDGLRTDFRNALKAAVPNLTEQDWIDLYWALFEPDERPPEL